MVPHRQPTSSPGGTGFTDQLAALRRRLLELRDLGQDDTSDVPAELAADLDTAYEELRVADEEVRSQQDQIAGLLERQAVLQWQQDRLLSVLPVPALVTDHLGIVRSVNAEAAGLMDIRVASLVGKPIFSMFDVEDRSRLRSLTQEETTLGDGRVAAKVARRDGQMVMVEVSVTRREQGGDLNWMLLDSDGPRSRGAADLGLPDALSRLAALPTRGRVQGEVLREAADICLAAMGDHLELSVTRGSPHDPEALSSTSQVAQRMDAAELEAGEGPCVDAFNQRVTVVTHDVRADPRWPRLTGIVPEGVASVVAVPIEVGERGVGVLNVYGDSPGAVVDVVDSVELLAATLGAVLYEMELNLELERLASDMDRALTTRATIEQAKGIVMADRRCGPDEAFAHLVQLSSSQERKLRDVAQTVVDQVARGSG